MQTILVWQPLIYTNSALKSKINCDTVIFATEVRSRILFTVFDGISHMKLHLTQAEGKYLITGYGEGWVQVNQERRHGAFLMTPEKLQAWPIADSTLLGADHFQAVVELAPEVFILGTGMRQKFPPAASLRLLIEAGIGYEVMDTPAACRTYNILMAEGRNVALGVTF
jgi:uncharacterized protein